MNDCGIRSLVLLAALAPLAASQATPGVARKSPPSDTVCARVVVVLQEGVSISSVAQQAAGLVLASDSLTNMHLIESKHLMPVGSQSQYVAAVASQPGVAVAELLQVVTLPEIEACAMPTGVSGQQCTIAFADGTPSDAEFHDQSSLDETGYKWGQQFGEHVPVLVAVIDTGVDASHPALAGHVTDTGWDFVNDQPGAVDLVDGLDNDGDSWVDEAYGHGTHLSSVILLVNPDARILPLRVLDADGNGDSFDVAEAIFYAVDHGAEVINLSLSMKETSSAIALALEYARYKRVAVFAAAGNTAKEKVLFPASYDSRTFKLDVPFLPLGWKPDGETVTAVAAAADWGMKADFSAWGPQVDILAPGENIYGAMPGGGYAWWSGTSMATAVASGVASLVVSAGGPTLPVPAQHVVLITAESIDCMNPEYVGGLGKGYIDALHAAWKATTY